MVPRSGDSYTLISLVSPAKIWKWYSYFSNQEVSLMVCSGTTTCFLSCSGKEQARLELIQELSEQTSWIFLCFYFMAMTTIFYNSKLNSNLPGNKITLRWHLLGQQLSGFASKAPTGPLFTFTTKTDCWYLHEFRLEPFRFQPSSSSFSCPIERIRLSWVAARFNPWVPGASRLLVLLLLKRLRGDHSLLACLSDWLGRSAGLAGRWHRTGASSWGNQGRLVSRCTCLRPHSWGGTPAPSGAPTCCSSILTWSCGVGGWSTGLLWRCFWPKVNRVRGTQVLDYNFDHWANIAQRPK